MPTLRARKHFGFYSNFTGNSVWLLRKWQKTFTGSLLFMHTWHELFKITSEAIALCVTVRVEQRANVQ